MAFVVRCDKCGCRYRPDESHACSGKPVQSAGVSEPASVPDGDPPRKSPAQKTREVYPAGQALDGGPLTPEEIARLREMLARSMEPSGVREKRLAAERQKRWRENNRERYNEYMREYRKRKR